MGGYSIYRRDSITKDIADALMGAGDLRATSATGASKASAIDGALLDAIFQARAPAPAAAAAPGKRPVTDEEYRQLIMQGLCA